MRVLIVEDNPINLAVLKGIISNITGCEPMAYCDPIAALNWCKAVPVDLVLVDYLMPEMDGVAFIREFRHDPRSVHVPIIMITGEVDRTLKIEAIERGATDFLNKPIDPHELKVRVTNLLALRNAQLELASRAQILTDEVEKATKSLLRREEEIIWRLARAIEYRDGGTGEHISRVASISQIIASEVGLDPEHCKMIYLASPLHDVGKIAVADAILNKPGKLTPGEMDQMRTHVSVGRDILADGNSDLVHTAALIAGTHHERWDGTGYPHGLAGEQIPIEGRIVAVADVFDALCTVRPYKAAWSLSAAREEILAQSGRHFDPACVAAFERAWSRIVTLMTEHPSASDAA